MCNRAGLHYAVVNFGDYPRELERVLIEDFDALPHNGAPPAGFAVMARPAGCAVGATGLE
jgi:hypothetical protein